MKALKDVLSRVKWKSVFMLLAALALLFLLIWAAIVYKPFSPGYKGSGDVQARSWVDPPLVELKGKSTAWVEVKNKGKEPSSVTVRLTALSKELTLEKTSAQSADEAVSLGPGESRKLNFKVLVNATYSGSYGIKVEVVPPRDLIEDRIFLEVAGK